MLGNASFRQLGSWLKLNAPGLPPALPPALLPEHHHHHNARAAQFIYRVDATNETRDLWRLMMDKGNFEEALTYCATEEDKNEVRCFAGGVRGTGEARGSGCGRRSEMLCVCEHLTAGTRAHPSQTPLCPYLHQQQVHAAQASYLFDNQEFERAASAFSKTDIPFETIALKFLGSSVQ